MSSNQDAIPSPSSRPFGKSARKRQARYRELLGGQAHRPNDDVGMRNGHLLALGSEEMNLYPSLRGPDGARRFFRDRNIRWWSSARSGDTSGARDLPTRNLASSQVCCVNFLLPLAQSESSLCALIQTIDED